LPWTTPDRRKKDCGKAYRRQSGPWTRIAAVCRLVSARRIGSNWPTWRRWVSWSRGSPSLATRSHIWSPT